jgi:transcription elongation factor Elf1
MNVNCPHCAHLNDVTVPLIFGRELVFTFTCSKCRNRIEIRLAVSFQEA